MSRTVLYILIAWTALWSIGVAAQTDGDADGPAQPTEGEVQMAALLAEITAQKQDIRQLEGRVAQYEGLAAKILSERLDRDWTAMFRNTLQLARAVAAEQENGNDVSDYIEQVVDDLTTLPDEARAALTRLRSRIAFPSTDMPPHEFVVADQVLLRNQKDLDEIYRVLIAYVEIAGAFDQQTDEERQFLIDALVDSAANRSAQSETRVLPATAG